MIQDSSHLRIRIVAASDFEQWLKLRVALWPNRDASSHRVDMAAFQKNVARRAVFGCFDGQGRLLGFSEVSLRQDGAGIKTSPVGFLEALYVASHARRQGVAKSLLKATEQWVARKGCSDLTAHSRLGDVDQQASHELLGFEPTEKVIIYRRTITAPSAENIAPPPVLSPPRTSSPIGDQKAVVEPARRGGRTVTVVNSLVALAGVLALFGADIKSPNVLEGAIYPMLGAICIIYVAGWFALCRYRRKTDERERRGEFFSPDDDLVP